MASSSPTMPNYALPQAIGIPAHSAMGKYTDSQYLADEAVLRQQIAQQYADVLQQLGYINPKTGQFILGTIQNEANMKMGDLQNQVHLADQQVTRNMTDRGTLFSGVRGTEQAQAEDPYVRQAAQLEYETPQSLAHLYDQAMGLVSQYNTQNNQLLMQAAQRRDAWLEAHPPATPPPDYHQGNSTDVGAGYGGDVIGRAVGGQQAQQTQADSMYSQGAVPPPPMGLGMNHPTPMNHPTEPGSGGVVPPPNPEVPIVSAAPTNPLNPMGGPAPGPGTEAIPAQTGYIDQNLTPLQQTETSLGGTDNIDPGILGGVQAHSLVHPLLHFANMGIHLPRNPAAAIHHAVVNAPPPTSIAALRLIAPKPQQTPVFSSDDIYRAAVARAGGNPLMLTK